MWFLCQMGHKYRVDVAGSAILALRGRNHLYEDEGDEVGGGGGTCEKNPTEAKTAHLMQN